MNIDSDSEFVSQHEKQSSNYAKFYRHFVEKRGEYRDYILIVSPGQGKTEVRREAKEEDKINYSRQWQAYQQGKENQISGTPLEMMGIDTGMIGALKALYVFSIEQLAELSDLAIQKIMGGNDLRNRAKAFIAKNTSEVIELRQKLEETKQNENTLRNEVDELKKRLDEFLSQPVRKKPGPKPKAAKNVSSHNHTERM